MLQFSIDLPAHILNSLFELLRSVISFVLELVLLLLLRWRLLANYLALGVQHQRTAVRARHATRSGTVRSRGLLLAVAVLRRVLLMVVRRRRRVVSVRRVLGLVVRCTVITPVGVRNICSVRTGVEVIHACTAEQVRAAVARLGT